MSELESRVAKLERRLRVAVTCCVVMVGLFCFAAAYQKVGVFGEIHAYNIHLLDESNSEVRGTWTVLKNGTAVLNMESSDGKRQITLLANEKQAWVEIADEKTGKVTEFNIDGLEEQDAPTK